jgi:hypothetical protein
MEICTAIRRAVDCTLFEKNLKILIRSITLIPIFFYIAHTFVDFGLCNICRHVAHATVYTRPHYKQETFHYNQEFSVQ